MTNQVKGKDTFLLYKNYRETLQMLSNEQTGIIFKALFDYVNGYTPVIDKNSAAYGAFSVIKAQVDYTTNKWLEKCAKNSENQKKRWQKEKENIIS